MKRIDAGYERNRRINILWTAQERLATEARIAGMWCKEDMEKAFKYASREDAENARIFTSFAGSKAREAFSFAIMSLELQDRIDVLRNT